MNGYRTIGKKILSLKFGTIMENRVEKELRGKRINEKGRSFQIFRAVNVKEGRLIVGQIFLIYTVSLNLHCPLK